MAPQNSSTAIEDFKTIDLSEEDSEKGFSIIPYSLGEVESKPYNPDPEREKLRGKIALILVSLLVGIVLMAFFTLWFAAPEKVSKLKEVLDLVVAPIVGIVGAVTGFYFGGKENH